MNPLIDDSITTLNSLGDKFCDYAGSMFIQSGVLIVLLLFVDFLIRKRVRATLRYWIWMLVFIKLILPPSLSLPTGLGYWHGEILQTATPVLDQVSTVIQKESAEPPPLISGTPILFEIPQNQLPQTPAKLTSPATPVVSYLNNLNWQAVVFALWLVGVLIFSALLTHRILYVRQLITQGEPSENRFIEILNHCRNQLGVRRHVGLRLSEHVSSPAVCGLFRPVILIPAALIEKLPSERLRAVLTHELAHIKRGDLWMNSAQTILQIIYFYNPLVWCVNLIVRRIREQAVDEMVLVSLGAGAKDYSNTLIDIAEMAFLKTNLSLRLIGVVESKKALNRRIRHMFNRPIPNNAKLGIVGLMTILILGAVLLPMARAQKQSIGNVVIDSDAQPKDKSESTKIDIPLDAKNLHVTKLSDELIEIGIVFRNQGSAPIPRFRVNFYAGDPDKGGRLLAPHNSGPIMPGDTWAEGTHPQRLRPGENVISVVVDPDNKVDESDETNNKVSRTISTTASETEKAHKVGAIQKVNLAGDDIFQIEAQEEKGFNFPYYLFIPSGMDKNKPIYMLVESNNSGTTSDDLDVHRVKAFRLAENSHATRMASRLGVPLLVPTFPRPRTNWWAYTHALDIDTLEINEGRLKRIDLQLTAMIKYAQELLRKNGFKINEKVFMHGFSASAKFCNRYSFLHPEMVKAVAAGGVNGLPTLPVKEWNRCELPFPIGIAGIEKFTDGSFNEEAFGKVAHYIYMGSVDKNDTLPSRDAWREEEADIIIKALAEKMMPDRWELSQKIYSRQKLSAQLVTYDGVGHSIKGQIQDDLIDFFKANAGENYVRIKPYKYQSVKSENLRPKDETGSAKIDIAIDNKDLYVKKQSDGRFRAVISIHNNGNTTTPSFKVIFYVGDPSRKGRKVYPGHHNAGPIMPGDTWNERTLPFTLNEDDNEIFVIVDPDNMADELDETNNKASVMIPGRQPKKPVEADTSSKQTTRKERETTTKLSGIDIKPANFDIRHDKNRGTYSLGVDIQNKSSLTIPRFKLRFYRGDPGNNLDEAGNAYEGWHRAGPLEPGKQWGEGTRGFHLPDGQYEFNVHLNFDNSIAEIDENNNRAVLQVKIENGRIADKSVTCPSSPKDLKTDVQAEVKVEPAESKVPVEMVGTWFFDNPHGDDEQMAVFPDGRVVVLYSNGHKDKTNIVDGFIELAEYNNAKCRMAVREGGTLVQYFGKSESNGKHWRRISPEPHSNLLASQTDSWGYRGKYFVKLSDDITVELVGVCDWPQEGKRCWRPDGLALPMEIYTTKRNIRQGFGKYGFMFKVAGPDNLNFSWNKILGASGWHGSCKVVDSKGNQLEGFEAAISDMEKGRLSTTIRIGIASGPWTTIASHDGRRMNSGKQGGVLWSQAFQAYSGTHIVTSREWRKDQTERVVAIDKEGKLHTTSHGSVASGKIDQLTASFRNLKLGQIEEFQYQVRPYQWVEFKNVSLGPGHKTDVEF